MNITKYATIFSIGILVTAVFAVTFSVFVANAQANEGYDIKKNIKIIKFKCNNINVNADGVEIIHTENNGPFCFNNNNNN